MMKLKVNEIKVDDGIMRRHHNPAVNVTAMNNMMQIKKGKKGMKLNLIWQFRYSVAESKGPATVYLRAKIE